MNCRDCGADVFKVGAPVLQPTAAGVPALYVGDLLPAWCRSCSGPLLLTGGLHATCLKNCAGVAPVIVRCLEAPPSPLRTYCDCPDCDGHQDAEDVDPDVCPVRLNDEGKPDRWHLVQLARDHYGECQPRRAPAKTKTRRKARAAS